MASAPEKSKKTLKSAFKFKKPPRLTIRTNTESKSIDLEDSVSICFVIIFCCNKGRELMNIKFSNKFC